MIKVWCGKKGVGKTKSLIAAANSLSAETKGDIVFIDRKPDYKFELTHRVRFVNASEYPVFDCRSFIGFIAGIITGNYDIEAIFIDGLTHITQYDEAEYEQFYHRLIELSQHNHVDFYLSHSMDSDEIPDYIKPFIE